MGFKFRLAFGLGAARVTFPDGQHDDGFPCVRLVTSIAGACSMSQSYGIEPLCPQHETAPAIGSITDATEVVAPTPACREWVAHSFRHSSDRETG